MNKLLYAVLVIALAGAVVSTTSATSLPWGGEGFAYAWAGVNDQYAVTEATSTGGSLLVTQFVSANSYGSYAEQNAVVNGDSGTTLIGTGGPNGYTEVLSQFSGGSMISHGTSLTTPDYSWTFERKQVQAQSTVTTATAADFTSHLTESSSSTSSFTRAFAFSRPGFVFTRT